MKFIDLKKTVSFALIFTKLWSFPFEIYSNFDGFMQKSVYKLQG